MVRNFPATIDPGDLEVLKWATRHLEHPSLAARLTSMVGTPIEIALKLMPRPIYQKVRATADASIGKVLKVAVSSLRHDVEPDPRNAMYRTLVAGTGAVGGLFGIYGLPVELAVSTTVMLRSIAEIARAEGEHIHEPEAQLACLEVFALGGHSETDDAADTGYYSVRLALAWSVTHAARHIARHGLDARGPVLVRLISAIGSRFGGAVLHKMAAQMVPVIGATAGATVNLVFINHFQEMARGHFVVRRLERKYGKEIVKANYERLVRAQ